MDNPLIKALCSAQAYAHPTKEIEVIETHISWVILTGDFAYKIKKPVNFGFLDFSTLEKRHFYCLEELRLNRRFSTELYLEVVAITGSAKHPEINGKGELIEYAVKMQQFKAGCLLSDLAQQQQLTAQHIDALVKVITVQHQQAEVAAQSSPFGEAKDIKHWSEENFVHIAGLLHTDKELQQARAIQSWALNTGKKKTGLMQQRKQLGFIRECHGDLHLGNITLIDGKIIPFDCIEFNPQLRWIDVISELAFVLMDLSYRQLEPYAWRLLNGYLQQTGDFDGLGMLHYYIAYRAMVRAKVALLSIQADTDQTTSQQKQLEYTAYANLAQRFTQTPCPLLLITHGFSGSGKSYYSRQLSEQLGTIHIRSDVERKRLFGLGALDCSDTDIKQGIYSAEASLKTYQHLAELAVSILNNGFNVIIDATFLKYEQRTQLQKIATAAQARFLILDFQAETATLAQRIEARNKAQNDASEATLAILQRQMATHEALTAEELEHTLLIDGSRTVQELVGSIK